jgi:glycosyltransferase involved in cell wall biosynthesis
VKVAIDAFALGSGRGGDETYLRSLLRGLAIVADDQHKFVICLRPNEPLPAGTEHRSNFSLRRLPLRSAVQRYLITLPRTLSRDPDGIDLLHAVLHAPLWGPTPVALFLPDLSFRHHPDLYQRRTRLRLDWLVPLHARQARVVITISDFSKRDIVSTLGVPSDRVFVVPIAIAQPVTKPLLSEPSASLAAKGVHGPYFLYLGNLHPRKNVARLIQAFIRARRSAPEVANHQLVIAGGRWWGEGDEEREARQAPPNSVIFMGRVSDDERQALLGMADALAYPSIFEGFGLPPLEAMAAGTPVLASNAAAIPEVCGDAALLVDPYRVDAIAEGLIALVANPELRMRLRDAGRRRVKLYTATATGTQALAAFTWALGGLAPVEGLAC